MTTQMEKFDSNIKEYKLQIEKLDNELLDTKTTYFRKQRAKESQRTELELEAPELVVEKASDVTSLLSVEEEEDTGQEGARDRQETEVEQKPEHDENSEDRERTDQENLDIQIIEQLEQKDSTIVDDKEEDIGPEESEEYIT